MPSEIFNPTLLLEALKEEGCTVINAVPSMYEALLKQETKYRLRNESTFANYKLRAGIIAGSTPPRHLLCAIKDQLNLSKLLYPFGLFHTLSITGDLLTGVGMTELSSVCLCTSLDDSLLDDNSSVGTAMPHTSVKVIDETGQALRVNTPGELCVSGYLVQLGYFRNETKTNEILITDQENRTWLRTGDIVELDHNGKCRVLGRSKDMIKKCKSRYDNHAITATN